MNPVAIQMNPVAIQMNPVAIQDESSSNSDESSGNSRLIQWQFKINPMAIQVFKSICFFCWTLNNTPQHIKIIFIHCFN